MVKKNLSIEEKIRMSAIYADMSMGDIAQQFGSSLSSFTQRLSRGRYKKEELEKIAGVLGCEYVCGFQFDDGILEKDVRGAATHIDKPLADIARAMGLSPSSFIQRLGRGRLTKENLEKIAGILDCDYICEFRFPDGTVF